MRGNYQLINSIKSIAFASVHIFSVTHSSPSSEDSEETTSIVLKKA